VLQGCGDERRHIVVSDGEVLTGRLSGCSGVARRNEHPFDAAALGELPGERVFASAAADDHDLHCRLPLVSEVTAANEDHGDAMLVRGVDDLLVTLAAARLDDSGHAPSRSDIDAVAEGEEGVARERKWLLPGGLGDGDPDRLNAGHLARSDA
jgi:hypothetical protein